MKTMAGLVIADSYEHTLEGLTDYRSLAAVPFGARYRVIDFILSNMVNAGIINIGIVTTQNYFSLMRHVSSGAPWDLNRKDSAVMFLPPFATENVNVVYENKLEAMQANLRYLRELKEKYILLSGCEYIGNINVKEMLEFHISTGARITVLDMKNTHNRKNGIPVTELKVDEDHCIVDVTGTKELTDNDNIAGGVYIMEKEDLTDVLEETLREGLKSFRFDVLKKAIKDGDKVMAFKMADPMLFIDDMSCYLRSSLDLLDAGVRSAIFHKKNFPIITRVKDSPPTKYGKGAKASNSLIADGVIVEGEVKNSVIFRGARIKKGAVVENSVIMQDTAVGEGARLNYCVLDKNAIINDGRCLSGYITHPFYLGHDGII